jgi:hypothetical protein
MGEQSRVLAATHMSGSIVRIPVHACVHERMCSCVRACMNVCVHMCSYDRMNACVRVRVCVRA